MGAGGGVEGAGWRRLRQGAQGERVSCEDSCALRRRRGLCAGCSEPDVAPHSRAPRTMSKHKA